MEQMIVKWSFNSVFSKAMGISDLNREYFTVLTLMQNSHSLINGVPFHINNNNRVFTDQLGLTS